MSIACKDGIINFSVRKRVSLEENINDIVKLHKKSCRLVLEAVDCQSHNSLKPHTCILPFSS